MTSFTLVLPEDCEVSHPDPTESISDKTKCTVGGAQVTCGCEIAADAGTYSCEGISPPPGKLFFVNCTQVSESLAQSAQPDVLIHATLDADADSDGRELAVQQIAQVAKASGPNPRLLVDENVEGDVIGLLKDHGAQSKVRRANAFRFSGTR